VRTSHTVTHPRAAAPFRGRVGCGGVFRPSRFLTAIPPPDSYTSMSEPVRRSVYLRRVDPARNMARFYELQVEIDLFGYVLLVRRWGRIGRTGEGQHLIDEHVSEEAAAQALEALTRAKTRRGYEPA
jgi:predicted DNA-binding WGR domain protein